ncbi:unnamed protein product [Rotaria sordida]|uniref:Fe2OG dioxygenase domain-containing protein n=2 Tax=Rotaria sordida TaxID=392033 RepID=A0A819HJJ6_9BILA|nr:unnamed protein product [Rotaria sordida]
MSKGDMIVWVEDFNAHGDSECKHYINESERAGYTKLGAYQMSYRSNDRVIIVSQRLSDLLFKRLSAYFPDSINNDGSIWEPIGLNEVFRFCRYDRGGTFDAHRDAYFARSVNERSFMTINIYLNDTDAGCTRFLNPTGKKIIFQCQPQAGKALIFLHDEYHDGDVLRLGSKYLMRTDLIYRLKSNINQQEYCLNDKHIQAKQIYIQTKERENKDSSAKTLNVQRKPWSCSLQ